MTRDGYLTYVPHQTIPKRGLEKPALLAIDLALHVTTHMLDGAKLQFNKGRVNGNWRCHQSG